MRPQPGQTQSLHGQTSGDTGPGTGEIGISQNPICYNITVDRKILLDEDSADHEQQLNSIRDDLKDLLPNKRAVRVGFVFVWGHGDTLREGVKIATKVRDEIKREFPASFRGAASKVLHSDIIGSRSLGEVQIELNLFSDSEWITGLEVECNMVDG
jgi:hypothetical protein